MKKLLLLLMSLPVIAGAQSVTKYKHKITDETWTETSWMPIIKKGPKTRGFEVDVRMYKKNDDYLMQLRITDQVRTHIVNEGNALGFYSGDQRILVLTCTDGMKSREELDFISYPITEQEIDLFLKSDINLVRMEYEKGFTEDKYAARYVKYLKNSMSMIKDGRRLDDQPFVLKDKTIRK